MEGFKHFERLNSNRSGMWSGTLFRAINSTDHSAALGKGLYLTDELSVAIMYGNDINKYFLEPSKILGTNTQEYDIIRIIARRAFNDSLAQEIANVAKKQGWEGIFCGAAFGLVLFNPKHKLHLIGPVSTE